MNHFELVRWYIVKNINKRRDVDIRVYKSLLFSYDLFIAARPLKQVCGFGMN